LWAVLFAAYAATLGVDAADGIRYASAEPHYLIGAASWAEGTGAGLADQYTDGVWREWQRTPLSTDGGAHGGRLLEPQGIGFPLLISPVYRLGGATLVAIVLAAVAALAFVLGAALARRVVPDPWATWAALFVGLSPPAVAFATAVTPALLAGALLAGASLCALAVRDRPLMRTAFGGGAMLAVLPWLHPWLLVPAVPVAALLARWTARRGRAVVALGTVEIQLASLVFYVSLNERLYGGLTPLAVGEHPSTGASSLGDYVDRFPRFVLVWLERQAGLLLFAPVVALAFLGVWLLWRSRRERLSRLVADQRDIEHAAFLAAAVCAAQVLVAVFLEPALWWGAGVVALPCAVPLVAWGLRHAPRVGWALGIVGWLATLWLAHDGTWDSGLEWGRAFPSAGTTYAAVVCLAVALCGGALLASELLRRRRALGT
jgi:hypothetical protein